MNGRVSCEKTAERPRLVKGVVKAKPKCIREPQSRSHSRLCRREGVNFFKWIILQYYRQFYQVEWNRADASLYEMRLFFLLLGEKQWVL